MTSEITISGRTYYKDLGEWRIRATEGSVYDAYVGECSEILDETERLRGEVQKWRTVAEGFAKTHRHRFGLDGAWDECNLAYEKAMRDE